VVAYFQKFDILLMSKISVSRQA